MLNIDKLIASAQECLGWPYVSPGTNDKNGIDCSGLFVKIYQDQGESIYHGSNTIYRKHCSEKGKLTSTKQLCPGMAVFKWNANTPSKFNDGLGDFQHIGLVISGSPLKIIHASSAAGKVTIDTKLGKWAYYGKLSAVDYGDFQEPASEPSTEPESGGEKMTAKVYASNGQPVNLRERPNKLSKVIMKVPVGAPVAIEMDDPEWCLISFEGKAGYMMREFLRYEQNEDSETVTVSRSELEKIYLEIGELLGIHG